MTAPAARVPDLIVGTARIHPDRVAVEDPAVRLTYAELVRRAGRAALGLARLTAPGDLVPIVAPRGADFITACLAAMFAGVVYVPLDERLPTGRLRDVFEDCRAPVVIDLCGRAGSLHPATVTLADLAGAGEGPPPAGRPRQDLVYAVYTSGSSGRPKAVLAEHTALGNLAAWYTRAYRIGPGVRALHTAGLAFDASMLEIWPCLTVGATVIAAPDEARMVPPRLVAYARETRASITFAPSPLAEVLLATVPDDEVPWKHLLTGGDVLHIDRVPVGWRVSNFYGPTEATVATSVWVADRVPEDGRAPIGRPLDGIRTLTVDENLRPVAPGRPGELLIGGVAVARGYHRRPELTAEKFITPAGISGRWYRSGDLVRDDPDGDLRFLGRVDDQMQVRGVRVEPGEVEAALLAHPAIEHAAVAQFDDSVGGRSLGALVVTRQGLPALRELRTFLADLVPAAVIPTRLRDVAQLPLTTNGKVDRAAVSAALELRTTKGA